MNQIEAIEFLKELKTTKSSYKVAKLIGVSWPTVRKWLSENPGRIQDEKLELIEKFKNANNTPSN